MRRITLILSLMGLFLVGSMLHAEELHWEKDLKSAFKVAAKEKKPLMVMVEGQHCRWCKKMRHHTLEDGNISRRLAAFVLVREDKEGAEAKSELPVVKFVPTIFFMTSEKKILERVTGYFNVGDFNSWIDDVEKALK